MDETVVATGFLRNDCEVLLLRRGDDVDSCPGKWGGVAGHAEGTPDAAIRREIREQTGIDPAEECTLVRRGEPFSVTDEDQTTRWLVHPYLFETTTREVEPNRETDAFEWVAATEILRRPTVPQLWTAYDEVRPRVETVEHDTTHGSAYISLRALAVLRDESAVLGAPDKGSTYESPAAVARALLDARPSMTVVANRIHRAMSRAGEGSPAAVANAARECIRDVLDADRSAAHEALPAVEGSTVATLSRSGTVLRALEMGSPECVVIPESRPGREGVAVAEELAEETAVVLTSDAGFAQQLDREGVDLLLVGADSITPEGAVVNKVGTRAAAAAAPADCRVVVVAASDKIRASDDSGDTDFEPRPREELYEGDVGLNVVNLTFDETPALFVDAVATERGLLGTDELAEIATEHAQDRGWQ